MKTIFFAALFSVVTSSALAGGIVFDFSDPDLDNVFDVSVMVEGADTNGLASYNIQVVGLTAAGVDNGGISFTPNTLSNLRHPDFATVGFGALLSGPIGSDEYSAAQSQFQVVNPLIGVGQVDIFVEAATGPADNYDIVLGVPAIIGVLDLGTTASFTDEQLLAMLAPNAALLDTSGSAATLLVPDSIGVSVTRVPEPTTAVLAMLGLVGVAARRRS